MIDRQCLLVYMNLKLKSIQNTLQILQYSTLTWTKTNLKLTNIIINCVESETSSQALFSFLLHTIVISCEFLRPWTNIICPHRESHSHNQATRSLIQCAT